MRNRLSTVPAIVDHDPEAVFAQSFLFGDNTYAGEEVAEEILVGRVGLADPDDQLFRNEEQVNRGLRGDVPEAEAQVVLVDDVARDFPVCDLLEDGFLRHGAGGVNDMNKDRGSDLTESCPPSFPVTPPWSQRSMVR